MKPTQFNNGIELENRLEEILKNANFSFKRNARMLD